jgi:drug/metabolite transporter (DMT)-like permease
MNASTRERQIAMALLFIVPVFFTTNQLVARIVHETIPPVGLAFWRWTFAFAILLPFTARPLWQHRKEIRREWRDLLALGILGMCICGAFVYIGAQTTTAINIGLIYGASPVAIVALAAIIYGEQLNRGKIIGFAIALIGVLVIILRGDVATLTELRFVRGDIWIAISATAWAIYVIILRHRPSVLPDQVRFAALILFGITILLPFHIAESLSGAALTLDLVTLSAIAIVAIVPGLAAYQGYAHVQRVLGAGSASLLMYLGPIYSAVLAWLLLGEVIEIYHYVGTALVLPGIFLATRRTSTQPTVPR